jgi:hypothetical protein
VNRSAFFSGNRASRSSASQALSSTHRIFQDVSDDSILGSASVFFSMIPVERLGIPFRLGISILRHLIAGCFQNRFSDLSPDCR